MKIKKLMRKETGITLIALVVTIIVLLILAGVSIQMLTGETGIIKNASTAKEETEIANEKEFIQRNIIERQMNKSLSNDNYKFYGTPLYDRNLENSSRWDIVVEKENNKTYGTDWYYIPKGEEIEGYGKTKYNWVVNYETGEVEGLEDKSYNEFSYKSSVAETEGLVLNLDSANISLDKSTWGKDITLYYYDEEKYGTIDLRKKAYEEEKGKNVTTYVGYDRQKSDSIGNYIDEKTNAFKFNGNNYIEKYNENGFDFSEGLTYEFYGKITGQVAATVTKEEEVNWNSWCGLFGFWNGEYNRQCDTRFGYVYKNGKIYYTLALKNNNIMYKQYGEWSNGGYSTWNQVKKIGDILNKDIYFTITINNIEGERVNQSIYVYIDGQTYEYTGWLLKEYYENFKETVKEQNYLELGRCTYGNESNWGYMRGLCYSTRIYNKALNETQIKANYEITKSFHEYIINNKN